MRWIMDCHHTTGSSLDGHKKCNLSEEDKESIVLPTTSFDEDHHSSFQGWALKNERKQVRFKQHVRVF